MNLSWWNSLESITKFNGKMQLLTVVFGAMTLIASFLFYISLQKIRCLQSQEKLEMQKSLDKLSPRHLKDNDKELLNSEFIKLNGTEIYIHHHEDIESSNFAQEIKDLMLSSGMIAKRFSFIGGSLHCGIIISASFPEVTQKILLNAFASIGIDTFIDPSMAAQSISIGIKESV